MKHNYLSILLAICLLLCPVYATPTHPTYTVDLNGIYYQLTKPMEVWDDTVYLSLDDFSKMTFTPVSQSGTTYSLTHNTQKLTLNTATNRYKIGHLTKYLTAPTRLVDDVLYVPLTLFELFGHTYHVDTSHVAITLTSPSSPIVDEPTTHTFKDSPYHLDAVPTHVIALSTQSHLEKALRTALGSKSYLAFMDNSNFRDVITLLKQKLRHSAYGEMTLTFRKLNTLLYPNVIEDTLTLPVTLSTSSKTLHLTIGEETMDCSSLWATYYPDYSTTQINLDKTIDTTLMHAFYTYYRNHFDLRDDTYFSPYMLISSEDANHMAHGAYTFSYDTAHQEVQTDYMVNIYRTESSEGIHYIIDLEAM